MTSTKHGAATIAEFERDFSRLHGFASDTITILHDIVNDLAKKRGVKSFCSILAADISKVKNYLGNLDEGLSGAGVAKERQRLFEVLQKLDELCQVITFLDRTQAANMCSEKLLMKISAAVAIPPPFRV